FTTTYTYDYEEALAGGSHPSVQLLDKNQNGIFEALPSEVIRGGNVVQIDHPNATLPGGGTQVAFDRFSFNAFGQEVSHRRAEGNIDATEYFTEANPTGALPTPPPLDGRPLNGSTGGLASAKVLDQSHEAGANSGSPAPPTAIRTEYGRDTLGRVDQETSGRGVISRMDLNELDQVYRVRPAYAIAAGAEPGLVPLTIETLTFYDARDRVVQTNTRIGNPDTPDDDSPVTPFPDAGYASTATVYDFASNVIEERAEIAPGIVRATQRAYDENDNSILGRSPEAVAGSQPGNVVQTTFDELDRPHVTVEAPGTLDSRQTSIDYYFASRSPTRMIDGRGFETIHAHDGYGREIETIDARGGVRETGFDAAGNVVSGRFTGEVESGGPTALLSEEAAVFDERERKAVVRSRLFLAGPPEVPLFTDGNADGWVEATTVYDRESRAVAMINDNGHTAQSILDGMGRSVVVIDAATNRVETNYDAASNPVLVRTVEVNPSGPPDTYTTLHVYDAASRRLATTDNAGGVVLTGFDARGFVTLVLDQEGNATRKLYDALGRSTRTEWVLTAAGKGPGGGSVGAPDPAQGGGDGLIREDTIYDRNDRIVGRRDDNGNLTEYAYSNRNQVIQEVHPDLSFSTFAYDPDGNLVLRIDPNGTSVVQSFDELDRLLSTTATPASGNPFGVIATTVQTFAYDGLGRMRLATDDNDGPANASIVEYDYDSLARVVVERNRIGGVAYPVSAGFDGVGNLKTLTHPSG
ncbi:MAG: hypothetical protein L0206_08340, partial [Actinobacteria bacterium]|nr:hypothetical protein [Actinomycetota bacterium]